MTLTQKLDAVMRERNLLQSGNDIRTVQELLGHEDLNTTAIYTHGDIANGVSPLDTMVRPVPAPLQIGGFDL